MSDTPIRSAIEAVRAARGEKADEAWAEAVSFELVMTDVRVELVARALSEAAEQIAQADEPAAELFGDAREWAAGRRAEWVADGADWSDDDEPTSVKGALFMVLLAAAGISLLFVAQTLLTAAWSEEISLAGAIFPTLLGAATVGAHALFTRLRERRSQLAAVAGTAALLLAVGGTLTAVAWLSNGISLGIATGWWHLAAALVLGILAFAALQFLPAPRRRVAAGPRDDDAWLKELGASLRTRGDITDHRANEIVEEAREHAADSGGSLGDEFGTPRAYAARFAKNPVVPARRRAIFSAALATVALVVLAIDLSDGGDFPYATFAWFAILALNAALTLAAWRTAARERA
ncbi:hypothetical protein GCM10010922_18850 [Microbacterium sorbitolivorans]|uniref:Uncharacterized protein n=1 Tax=Microbacterium sorbitolivorans TaxID=1867410 RepID=A0A367Y8W1_9MICO|nr:hypothetical protein [Microbacterium sorbitolivorans]RCK62050.1 hypothetical protein DTO57_05470 [Microbacterium sorbitolivorans]GGF43572.1 hypothetical protein GCM10010922_18850 [Microbacterium sorbitolivorans]